MAVWQGASRHQRGMLVAFGCTVALHVVAVMAVHGGAGSGERGAVARAAVMVARIVEAPLRATGDTTAAMAPLASLATPGADVAASWTSSGPEATLADARLTALMAALPQHAASMPSPSPTAPAAAATATTTTAAGFAVDQSPRPLADVNPETPAGAGARGGTVTLRLVISERGEVEHAAVVSATPPGLFEEAALAAFGRARYAPGLRGGVPVRSEVTYQVDFAPLSTGADASTRTY